MDASASPNGTLSGPAYQDALYNTAIRHGFAADYESDQYMEFLAEVFYIYYEDKRHETAGKPRSVAKTTKFQEWRIRDRQRTVTAALVLCLNIGVDPPDVIKTQPCAKTEAGVDPTAFNDPKKAIEQIGKSLQTQYEALSTRTKYKQSLDPNVEDAKRFCINLRRTARDERILFHYNGHGVPRPTPNGEIWVFNRGYTQYIPVSVYDLQTWLGAPCIYAYDCHAAGHIVNNFLEFVEKRKEAERRGVERDPSVPPAEAYDNCIQLAACRADEVLPMHPDLPADLFTCCITNPIEIAVNWFILQSPTLRNKFAASIKQGSNASSTNGSGGVRIPGKITDRRTPLGELNWIFTAITDTIAWSTLESSLFKRLFRQDLVVAAMFRNFLLAVRIMRVHNCHPVSSPALPPTHSHPMWDSWDLAVDHCLMQLPELLEAQREGGTPYEYKHSDFFEQQLTAFEMWLKFKSASELDRPPEQLPVLLQVLLSQIHRLRALILLSKYLDLGPKAVHLALSIGIFPYVLKLLQSPAPELKPVLVFIWTRIMAVDYKNIQFELVKENGYAYFINILVPHGHVPAADINVHEHLAMCAFVIALFCRGFKQGQRLCASPDLLNACLTHAAEQDSPLLRQWACLCLSQMWDDYEEAKFLVLREDGAVDRLASLLSDPIPEVRTSCIVALSTFLGDGSLPPGDIPANVRRVEHDLALSVLSLTNDGASIVRREVVVFLSKFVKQYQSFFLVAAFSAMEEDAAELRDHGEAVAAVRQSSPAHGTVFMTVWRALMVLSEDPFLEVAEFAQDVVDYVLALLLRTPLAEETVRLQTALYQQSDVRRRALTRPTHVSRASDASDVSVASAFDRDLNQIHKPTRTHSSSAAESPLALTLRRSASIAAALKNLAWGSPEPDSRAASSSTNPNRRKLSSSASAANVDAAATWDETNFRVFTPRPVGHRDKNYREPVTLPLASGFFAWSCEYFQEPQMCKNDADEPGSEKYIERVWRKSRNERIIGETQTQKDLAAHGTWDTQTGSLHNITAPGKMVFAQFEPHLVSADERDIVTVWDWERGMRLNRFSNANPAGTRVTDAKFLNEDDVPLLLAGSSDGVVRVYRHYSSPKTIEIASSWRVLTDLASMRRHETLLVAEWQQSRGTLLVGGDARVIRVWDAPRELCIADIPARSGAPVTSLTSDQVAGNIIVAGFSDGAIRYVILFFSSSTTPTPQPFRCFRC